MNTNYLASTPILNHDQPAIRELADQIEGESLEFVRAAHRYLVATLQPIYTLNDLQPASITLAKRSGSCSQRTAVLEAVSRSKGIATRVRGLIIDGSFWNNRFPLVHAFLPSQVLLAWPQFLISDRWIDFDEIFGDADELAKNDPIGFHNNGETLFEAVCHTSVDFLGKTKSDACECNLNRFVKDDVGLFTSRDELFAKHSLLKNTWRGAAFQLFFAERKSYSISPALID